MNKNQMIKKLTEKRNCKKEDFSYWTLKKVQDFYFFAFYEEFNEGRLNGKFKSKEDFLKQEV